MTSLPEKGDAVPPPEQVRRLNWGCGTNNVPTGWINADIKGAPGIEIVDDIADGLPLE